MKNKKILIILICIICLSAVVVVFTLFFTRSKKYRLVLEDNTTAYTLTSGNTGKVYDITDEEFNQIAQKLKEAELTKSSEKSTGWLYMISYCDSNNNYHNLIISSKKISYDNADYNVLNNSADNLYEYMESLGKKYFTMR